MRLDHLLRDLGADPYTVLGLDRDAERQAILAARRRLMRVHHPDTGTGSAVKARQVNLAADLLLDPILRVEYDLRHRPVPVAGRLQGTRSDAPDAPVDDAAPFSGDPSFFEGPLPSDGSPTTGLPVQEHVPWYRVRHWVGGALTKVAFGSLALSVAVEVIAGLLLSFWLWRQDGALAEVVAHRTKAVGVLGFTGGWVFVAVAFGLYAIEAFRPSRVVYGVYTGALTLLYWFVFLVSADSVGHAGFLIVFAVAGLLLLSSFVVVLFDDEVPWRPTNDGEGRGW